MPFRTYSKIHDQFAALISTTHGHHGTYSQFHGGDYAIAVCKWLDWRLKGEEGQSALFLDPEYIKIKFPTWTMENNK